MLSLNASGALNSLAEILSLLEASVWRFHAVGDDRTCEDCASLDGETWIVDDVEELTDVFPYGEVVDYKTFKPNIHPNCRCVVRFAGEL